jgi:hypothetical protein
LHGTTSTTKKYVEIEYFEIVQKIDEQHKDFIDVFVLVIVKRFHPLSTIEHMYG